MFQLKAVQVFQVLHWKQDKIVNPRCDHCRDFLSDCAKLLSETGMFFPQDFI